MREKYSERLMDVFSNYPIFEIVVGLLIIGGVITLGIFALIPVWLAAGVGIFSWLVIGITFWRYESWRASGPRGTYWNPAGIGTYYGTTTLLIWGTCGLFLSLAHSFCRQGWHAWVRKNILFW